MCYPHFVGTLIGLFMVVYRATDSILHAAVSEIEKAIQAVRSSSSL